MTEQVLWLIVLLLLSGLFSSAETSLFSISKTKARHIAKEAGKANALIKRMKDDPHRLLSTILIGNNVVNVAASAIATTISIKVVSQLRCRFGNGRDDLFNSCIWRGLPKIIGDP